MKKQQNPLYVDIRSLVEMFLMKIVMYEVSHNINLKKICFSTAVCCSIFLSHPLPPANHPLVLCYTFSFLPPFPPPPLLFFLKCMQIVVILYASLPSRCLQIFNAAYFQPRHPPTARHSTHLGFAPYFWRQRQFAHFLDRDSLYIKVADKQHPC